MGWKFSDDVPLYQQIMDGIKQRIATGDWVPGQKLPSVRELAVEAGVNPNTMQKALAELEREGLLYAKRTAGRFVAERDEITEGLQEEMLQSYVKEFLGNMESLGYSLKDAAALLQRMSQQEERKGE
ncbi:MAG: GntR family transcriptional regulator [Lachnospiraceae bacterium]|nr:GntR family transcriptional regulator [Lachnospiraceae bacterium]